MGNSAALPPPQALRTLELRVSEPRLVWLPPGSNGQQRTLFAKVGLLEDRGAAVEVSWDEPVQIQLRGERSTLLVSLYAAEYSQGHEERRALYEVALPYWGPGGLADLGLAEGGAPVTLVLAVSPGKRCGERQSREELAEELRQAREQYHPDRPFLGLSVSEVGIQQLQQSAEDGAWHLPSARRQVIALELQNAALLERKRELQQAHPDYVWQMPEAAAEETAGPTHVQQLLLIQQENQQLRAEKAAMLQKLEHTRQLLSGATRNRPGAEHDWADTLRVMTQELAHCRDRQVKIRANYDERKRDLQVQLQAAQEQAAAQASQQRALAQEQVGQEAAALQAEIERATLRRNELIRQCQEARDAAEEQKRGIEQGVFDALSSNPDIQRLARESEQYKIELRELQHELSAQQERDAGSKRQDHLQRNRQQLLFELEELDKVGEDERVRSESEVRELKNERDLVKEHLDKATAELQHLRVKAEALRGLRAQNLGLEPPDNGVERLEQETDQLARDLEDLRSTEDARKSTIEELEREQEELVAKTSMITGKAVPCEAGDPGEYARGLEEKVRELQGALQQGAASCTELQREVSHLRAASEEAKRRSAALQESYEALQRSSDERMSQPGTPALR